MCIKTFVHGVFLIALTTIKYIQTSVLNDAKSLLIFVLVHVGCSFLEQKCENSTHNVSDDRETKKDILNGEYQTVFFTPEMILGSKKWRTILTS